MTAYPSPRWLLVSILASTTVGCGGSGSSDANTSSVDGAVDDSGGDTERADVAADAYADEEAAPWKDTVSVVGVGSAVGTGFLGPVYPTGLWASTDQVVVVGLAKSDFSWGGKTYPRGGFVLAIDPATGAARWHRQVGDSVGGITAVGDELAIVGSFSKSISLPTASTPIALTSAGLTDGVVAVLTKSGDFRWARRFGSPSFDHGFAITSDVDAVVVAGAITGLAGLGDGCGALQAQIGGDDGEGHPVGIYDAVVLRYGAGGSCPWAAAIGAPMADDMGFGVTSIDGSLFITGASARPMSLRTTAAGIDVDLGGATTKRPSPFLLRLDPKGTQPPSAWFIAEASGGGRGRALAHRGNDVLWAFTSISSSKLLHDALAPIDVSEGAHVSTLHDDTLLRTVDLGPKTLDIGPLAIADSSTLVAASEADPSGVVLTKLMGASTSIARHPAAGATGLPFVIGADGATAWVVGYAVATISLGEPPVKIDPGPQGGFFLARLSL